MTFPKPPPIVEQKSVNELKERMSKASLDYSEQMSRIASHFNRRSLMAINPSLQIVQLQIQVTSIVNDLTSLITYLHKIGVVRNPEYLEEATQNLKQLANSLENVKVN